MSGKTGKLSLRLRSLAIVDGFLDGERFDLAAGTTPIARAVGIDREQSGQAGQPNQRVLAGFPYSTWECSDSLLWETNELGRRRSDSVKEY